MDEDMMTNGTDSVTADARPIKADDDDMPIGDDTKANDQDEELEGSTKTDHEEIDGEEWDDAEEAEEEDDDLGSDSEK